MSKSYPTSIVEDEESAVSWGAILAGAFAAGALTLILAALGTGVGLALTSPWANSGVSPTTFKLTAGLYLLVTAVISSTIGGYMAGRLRTQWSAAPAQEVLFRDTAHGLVAWAIATLLLAAVLGTGTLSLVGMSVRGVSQGTAQAASSNPTDYFVDMLLRPAPSTALASTQADPTATRREVSSIFARDFAPGAEFPVADRTYLVQLVASRSSLSPEEADKRVSDVLTQTKTYLDSARKYSIALSLWVTLSLFAGAFAASAGAIEGGQLRDGRWRGLIFAPRDEVNK
jgi:hypothetical protein